MILQQPNESAKAYRVRLYMNKDLYGLSNVEIGNLCNKAFGVNYDESTHRKKTMNYLQGYYDAKEEFDNADDQISSLLNELKETKRELQKERYKLQSEKIDYNRSLREEARDELITEKIVNAIHDLDELNAPLQILNEKHDDKKEYVLVISDSHFGSEFCIKGFRGEIINEYSPEIFKKRMNVLFDEVLEIIKKENIDCLHIYNLGDDIDGCLRVSQLWKLRYGVVDATIKYADIMSTWLNNLSYYVQIKYQMVVDSNHSQLRMLGQPKNTFKEDNMSKVISSFIKERLRNNPNFIFTENETGMIYDNLCGYNIVGFHGESKNMKKTIHNFSKIYNIDINYLLAGHYHHNVYEEGGKYCDCINVGSIIGVDDYSLSLQTTALSSAKLLCFKSGKGKAIEYNIILE